MRYEVHGWRRDDKSMHLLAASDTRPLLQPLIDAHRDTFGAMELIENADRGSAILSAWSEDWEAAAVAARSNT